MRVKSQQLRKQKNGCKKTMKRKLYCEMINKFVRLVRLDWEKEREDTRYQHQEREVAPLQTPRTVREQ